MTQRSATEHQVADLLHTAQEALPVSIAFLSRLDGDTQCLEVVESTVPIPFGDGACLPRATSLCQGVLDGRMPPVVPDLHAHRHGGTCRRRRCPGCVASCPCPCGSAAAGSTARSARSAPTPTTG